MAEMTHPVPTLTEGDFVEKVGGDYTFEGVIVSVFTKRSGAYRFVVEDDRGALHIYSEKNLQRIESPTQTLASRLLEALQHVEGCQTCAECGWFDCHQGGKEAFEVKKEAERVLKM